MITKSIEIVKKNKVRSGDTIRIRAGQGGIPARPSALAAAPQHGPMQARVVESNPDYAIIEVICPCGHKTHIQCHYADAAKSL
jgi:hypothetical protein